MKKTFAFLAVALLAAASQAATIKWTSGKITKENGTTAGLNEVVGYLFLVDQVTWDGFTAGTSDMSPYITAEGGPAQAASATGSSTAKGLVFINTTATQADGMQYALFFYVDQTTHKVLATKGQDYINAVGSAAGIASGSVLLNQYAASGWASPAPVPEPVSAALLALGLAALGLRRKVRA